MGSNTSFPLDDFAYLFYLKLFFFFGWFLFSEVVHSYTSLIAELERLVMRMVLESYGIMKKHVDSHSTASSRYLLRLLRNKKPELNENNIAFPTHTDKSFIAILQQNHVSGLEVDTKNGKSWFAFEPPSPSFFIVMAGDAFMVRSSLVFYLLLSCKKF